MYKLNVISVYFKYFYCIFLLLPHDALTGTFIIKLAGAVDSTTLPTMPEKSVDNVKYRFCYVNMFICFPIFSTNLFKCLLLL